MIVMLQRFLSLDPLAADFANMSPYNYVLANPVMLVDPDGRIPILPMIIGGITGAGLDLAIQVGSNYASGRSLGDINWKSVGISTVAGGTGVGLLSKARLVLNGRTLKATEMGIDAAINIGTQYYQDGSVDLRETAISVIAGQSVRNPAQSSVKAGAQETTGSLTSAVQVAETGLEAAKKKNRKGLDPTKTNKQLASHQKKVTDARAALNSKQNAVAIDGVISGGLSSGATQKAVNSFVPGTGPVYNFKEHPYVEKRD